MSVSSNEACATTVRTGAESATTVTVPGQQAGGETDIRPSATDSSLGFGNAGPRATLAARDRFGLSGRPFAPPIGSGRKQEQLGILATNERARVTGPLFFSAASAQSIPESNAAEDPRWFRPTCNQGAI